jgi:hypothetical protein
MKVSRSSLASPSPSVGTPGYALVNSVRTRLWNWSTVSSGIWRAFRNSCWASLAPASVMNRPSSSVRRSSAVCPAARNSMSWVMRAASPSIAVRSSRRARASSHSHMAAIPSKYFRHVIQSAAWPDSNGRTLTGRLLAMIATGAGPTGGPPPGPGAGGGAPPPPGPGIGHGP